MVLDEAGSVINPCHPARARKLVRNKRAKLVSRHPYSIQLLANSHEQETVTSS